MAYLGNSPHQTTVLQVEARKSFSLALRIKDPNGKPVDLAGCTITIVAKPEPIDIAGGQLNLLEADETAELVDASKGYARFSIQAATLDHAPGEYPYAIVLQTGDGYSSVLVKGLLAIQQNTEFESVLFEYEGVNPPQALNVTLRGMNVIDVYIGGQLPPGMNWVRDDIVEIIETFNPRSAAVVPEGGTAGYVLTKMTHGDYEMAWLPVGQGAFALDASHQPAGNVPVATGDDTWIWAAVGLDASGVPEGLAPVARGDGTWSWSEVSTDKPDWKAPAGSDAEILNKPPLGTAAAANTTDFISASTLVSQMPGVTFRTSVPTSGVDGHLYFVYEA